MEHAVAFMIGSTAMVLGFSLILHWKGWLAWTQRIRDLGTPAALLMGYLHLLVGTFIVGFHWKWQGLPLLLTLIGVKAIAEGVVYTLCPSVLPAMLRWYEPHARMLFRIGGLLTIIIGLLILCEWRQVMWPECATWSPCFNQASEESNHGIVRDAH